MAKDLILSDGKASNYEFVAQDCPLIVAQSMFKENGLLEAILITKDGRPNGQLVGIIRPRDILNI